MHHPSLRHDASNLLAGSWLPLTGTDLSSHNPAKPSAVIWAGGSDVSHVDRAVAAAREAGKVWARWTLERRMAVLRRYQQICAARVDEIATLIRDETGKVMWDSKAEAGLLGGKVDITLDQGPEGAFRRVAGMETKLAETRQGRAWFRPHGVMAVVGPFNFPMHLPNGHIVPALLMGNTIVFKPSDKTPGCGQLLAELLQEALEAEGAPSGVVNLVQGRADVAQRLVRHEGVDGVLFTGSWPVGRAILEANLDSPGKICALEMGGNNAAVVMPDADLKQAVIECVRSAFITTGQRCTCTRRLVVHEAVAERVIKAVCKAASNLIIGEPDAAHPVFMGPVVSEGARRGILDAQAALAKAGGEMLMPCTAMDREGWFVTPGVMRVERFGSPLPEGGGRGRVDSVTTGGDVRGRNVEPTPGPSLREGSKSNPPPGPLPLGGGEDLEVFGPLLRVAVVGSLDEAIEQANATRYGLAASIFTKDPVAIERFLHEARAGCVNVNTGTAGASSKLPFGGLGLSGNHRPAGSFSLDYCAYPVAGMLESGAAAMVPAGMRFEEGWLA